MDPNTLLLKIAKNIGDWIVHHINPYYLLLGLAICGLVAFIGYIFGWDEKAREEKMRNYREGELKNICGKSFKVIKAGKDTVCRGTLESSEKRYAFEDEGYVLEISETELKNLQQGTPLETRLGTITKKEDGEKFKLITDKGFVIVGTFSILPQRYNIVGKGGEIITTLSRTEVLLVYYDGKRELSNGDIVEMLE